MGWKRRIISSLSNFPKQHLNSKSTFLLKFTIVSAFIFSTLFFTVSSPSADTNLKTVFHVYSNNEYVGTVSDKSIIDNIVNQKIDASKEIYGDYQIDLESQITYIPEQVFRPIVDDDKTLKEIQNRLTVEAEAVGIFINGKEVTYVKSKEDAQQVEQNLKLKFVSKKDLEKLDNEKKTVKTISSKAKEPTHLLDVSFDEKVSFKDTKINPSKILSTDEAVKFLLKGTIKEKKYKVKNGDVLGSIAADHNLKEEQLMELNPKISEESLLQIGDELNVTVYEPLIHVLVKKEVSKVENVPYEKEVKEDSTMFKGDIETVQKGKKGKSNFTYIVTEENGQQQKKEIKSEKVIVKPVKYIVVKGTKVVPSRGTGNFGWPVDGGYISSKVGYRWEKMHKGIDIARPSSGTIKAADNGIVVSAGWDNGGYGNKIIIDHHNGYRTIYAHLSSIKVSVGQTVAKGSKIGVMGATGDATGVHLHFELYKNGNLQNPLNYIN